MDGQADFKPNSTDFVFICPNRTREMKLCFIVHIVGVGILLRFVLPAFSLPGLCADTTDCINGTCVDSTGVNHTCLCDLDYIGDFCDQEFVFSVIVSNSVPTKGEAVTFTSNLKFSEDANVSLTIRNEDNSDLIAPVGDSKIHEIQSVGFDDVGNYLFVASVPYKGKTYHHNQNVTIDYVLTVEITAPSETVHFEKGEESKTISVEVSTNGSFDQITVTAEKDDTDIITWVSTSTVAKGTRTYTYEFASAVTEANAGQYVIEAIENYEGVTKKAVVTVTVVIEIPASEPQIEGAPEATVTRGVESRLVCSHAVIVPTVRLSWSYDGAPVSTTTSDAVYEDRNGVLVFRTGVTFDVNGTYTCTAMNELNSTGVKKAEASILITIEGEPVLVSFTPDVVLQKEELEFSCEFDAYPPPVITWTFGGRPGAEFLLFEDTTSTSEEKYYKTTTQRTILHSALCLGNNTIKCQANNKLGAVEKKFQINSDHYNIYMDSYIIFPNAPKNFSDASGFCTNLGGFLVDIRSDIDQSTVTSFADQDEITEFYIGLKYDSTWKWPDDSELQGFQDWEDPSSPTSTTSCAVNKKSPSTWSWVKVDCSETKTFACKVQASKFPSSLTVNADTCNGQNAIMNWTTDGDFNQSIEMQPTKDTWPSDLQKNISTIDYADLAFGTEYKVKVSTGVGICDLLPYAEETFTTANEKALEPTVTVNSTNCDVSWTYPDARKEELDGFQLIVTETVILENNNGVPTTIKNDTNFQEYSYDIATNPNSQYDIEIRAMSCIGNSEKAKSQICTTDPVATKPPTLSSPTTSLNADGGIPINLPAYSERDGKISCVYVVVRWTRSGEDFPAFELDETSFAAIKQAEDNVEDGTHYFAFAGNNGEKNITLGDGSVSSCSPPPGRRKREASIQKRTISAENRPLKGDAEYRFYIILAVLDGSNYLLANGDWSEPIAVSEVPNENIAAIVIPILVVILLILIVVLYLLIRKRRKKSSQSQQPTQQGTPARHAHINQAFNDNVYDNIREDTSIAAENLRSTYQAKHADEDRLFREEYRALAMEVSELNVHFNYAMATEVREKNRFSNIHPANESRVVLRREGNDIYSDYINASYLDGYRHPRKFIASQGPLQNTIGDFWYMIWEQESTVVVMLTKVDEGGRRKCENYWPENNEERTFDNLMVKTISVVEYGPIIKRTFQLSNPNQSQKKVHVEQFHYITWPDHGVPITTSALFNLRRMVLESQGNNPSPIIVHCSAGVGRTGTFVALDYLINQIARERKVDIYGAVLNMRRKRKEMVQTVEQYALLHKLMLEIHLFGITDRKNSEFLNSHQTTYQTVEDEDGFYNLSIIAPFTAETSLPDGSEDKVRDKLILPYQHCKVVIRMRPSEDRSRFINASYVQTYSANEAFIACQGPVESGIEDFWRVVLDHNVTAIVMLSKLKENGEEQCSKYWPDNSETPRVFGDVTITLQSQTERNGIIERWMNVSEKVLHLRRSLNVMQLQYENWPSGSVPPNATDILDMISRSQSSRKSAQGKSPVLVHCRDGSGRTGTFCAIVNLIERLKNEDRIDVFRTVKDLRDMRPLMVTSLEQYKFCVGAMKEYLDSFHLYANFK